MSTFIRRMASMRPRLLALPMALLLVVALAACARTPAPHLYLLDLPSTRVPVGAGQGPAVGLEPLHLPRYLDRPQIVTRDGAHRLRAAQAHVWAEPLAESASRVLAASIGGALDSNRVHILPQRPRPPLDWRVAVEIIRLDGVVGTTASLAARWALYRGDEPAPRMTRYARIDQASDGSSYDAFVAALNGTLEHLGQDIAAAIAAVRP